MYVAVAIVVSKLHYVLFVYQYSIYIIIEVWCAVRSTPKFVLTLACASQV